ncbi:NAD binding domain of 6-phosphogluconate dehydrogenase-domain-containing protein [Pyrenochaeta sp. MPI-SDFR-AT-0127]|nr:NAD binding domain of 6-phosphogluconate dehydrogenase-domain-containing protein [Pyrenochaeta sp. MPI-SDFR-AT-0127]
MLATPKPTSYGFIGLGLMGLPMCKSLATKIGPGHQIHVFDINEAAMNQLYQDQPDMISRCSSAAEVAEGADIILTMLPEGRHAESVYLSGPHALASRSLEGKLLIDCSTIDPATSLSIKEQLHFSFPTASFYDAPVSGGVIGAVKGSISFFVGCDEATDTLFPSVIQPTLRMMGKQIIPCGGPSLGLTAKLCNNYLSGILTIACSETFNISMRAGLNPKKLYQVLGAGSAQNTICDKFCPVPNVNPQSPSSHGFKGGFRMALMLKDFTLATQITERGGAQRILSARGLEMYSLLSEDSQYKNLDVRAIFRYLGGQEDWDERHG